MTPPDTATVSAPVSLAAKDFASDQEVRWCPGCGDYSILAQTRKVMADAGLPLEKICVVSGIGCSSRFPYYFSSYGFHTIHGRAPAFATGIKTANPDLQVWMATGDGDGLSIGGNHLLHVLRRNLDIKLLLFNNRIYGLTKGQYSPTSEIGKKTKSTPFGSLETPVNPVRFALAAEASFVARSVDADVKGLVSVLQRVHEHKGTAFLEIYQDCNVYNHLAFDFATNKTTRPDNTIVLEHGQPMLFGKDKEKGIRLNGLHLEVVTIGENGVSAGDILVHDETNLNLAWMIANAHYPEFPEPMGVIYAAPRPTYDGMLNAQIEDTIAKRGKGDLRKLLSTGDTWEVK